MHREDITRTGRPWNISLLTYYVGTHLVQDPVIYLLETKWLQPKILGTRVEGTGSNQMIDVIEAEIEALRVDLYLDIKTRPPFKMVTNVSDGSGQYQPGELSPLG